MPALTSQELVKLESLLDIKKKSLNLSVYPAFITKNGRRQICSFSLYQARDWLLSDDCIVAYSDIYTEDSIVPLLNTQADISITYDPNWLDQWSKRFADPLEDAETFNQENGWLTEIVDNRSRLIK